MKLRQPLVSYPSTLKQQARRSLTLAADWAARNQIRDAWPAWDANKGRFPYHILIDPAQRATKPQIWSTCWKTARAAQGLYDAYLITGKPEHLAAANLGMEYVATLQVFEPGYEKIHGAFREDSPQGPHIASRDGMEAIQGFISGYVVTKNPRFLRRAVAGTDFLLRAMKIGMWPFGYIPPAGPYVKQGDHFCLYAGALVFAQMYALTGNKAYLTRGLIPFANRILKNYVRADGALGVLIPDLNNHHMTKDGELAGVFINDDGLGVALLAAHAVTGDVRYRDAAVGAADFWTRVTTTPDRLAVFPCVALFLSDVYRLTGDRKYLPRIAEYAAQTVALQHLSPHEPFLHGCYEGEDLAAVRYDKTTKPLDYVDLRMTAYALIALSKIAATKPNQWGCAYSCYGW